MDIITNLTDLFSQTWLWLVVGGSILFAIGNFIDEGMLEKLNIPVGALVINSGIFGFLIAGGFAIYAFNTDVSIKLPPNLISKSLIIGVLEMAWTIPYLYATERRGAIVAGPLFQLVPVIALFLEAFHGVVPPLVQIIGALLIVTGGILLSIEEERDENGVVVKRVDRITFILMAVATIIVAVIYVEFKDAALDSNYIAVGFWTGIGIGLTGSIIYLVWKPYRDEAKEFWSNIKWFGLFGQLTNELADAGGVYMIHLANLMGASVMVVTAFEAVQPIIIGLISVLIFAFQVLFMGRREKISWKAVLFVIGAIALIASGTLFVAVG